MIAQKGIILHLKLNKDRNKKIHNQKVKYALLFVETHVLNLCYSENPNNVSLGKKWPHGILNTNECNYTYQVEIADCDHEFLLLLMHHHPEFPSRDHIIVFVLQLYLSTE